MPETRYHRHVAHLRIETPARGGGARVRFGSRSTVLDEATLRDVAQGWQREARDQLDTLGLATWWQRHVRVLTRPDPPWPSELQPIAVLELDVNAAHVATPWEELLEPLVQSPQYPGAALVRVCPVPPRVADWPFGLPMRMVQVGTSLPSLDRRAELLFRWRAAQRELVLRTATSTVAGLREWWGSADWPGVDVLELALPVGEVGVPSSSAADPAQAWSLGWLEQLCIELRTRLVTMVAPDAESAERARVVAHRLVDRGGPAVVVVPPPAAADRLQELYAAIVHDRPLDWAVADLRHAGGAPQGAPTLVAGQGRADLVRVSAAFRPAVDLATRLREVDEADRPEELRLLSNAVEGATAERLLHSWRGGSRALLRAWDRASYELHESDGVIPMQEAMARMRRRLGIRGPLALAAPSAPRTVTPRLSQEDATGRVAAVAQSGGNLIPGAQFLLSVGIGPTDDLVRVAGATGLVEEVLFHRPDEPGAWLDITVMGLTAPVRGEQVQRLWLPRTGPSEQATFRIDPGGAHTWRVRVLVHHENLLLQALLVAAAGSSEGTGTTARDLAHLLKVPETALPEDPTWFARVEYSLSPGELGPNPAGQVRPLSLTANTLDDARALLLKGPDLAIEVRLPANVDEKVAAARQALADVATPPVPGAHAEDLLYGFADDNSDARGRYDAVMAAMAWRGWALYEGLVPAPARAAVARALGEGAGPPAAGLGSIINVGHMLVDHVVPWSLVYDRPYQRNRRTLPTGERLAHVACRALAPGPELPDRCAVHPACPLHPDRLEERRASGQPLVDESTVTCPRHFWGFRHVVEVPASREAGSAFRSVGPAGPVRAGVGMHRALRRAGDHLATLAADVSQVGQVAWREGNRDRLQELLAEVLDLDVLYLYCHAGFDGVDEVLRVMGDADATEGLLAAADLAGDPFTTHPLVFVNGCRTAGFSPRALSPFITTLVTDRDASGLVGTEIDVWEQLAVEVGREFLLRFLTVPGMTAGRALRETRLGLLARGNPLGLAYTLYALGDLRLRDAPP